MPGQPKLTAHSDLNALGRNVRIAYLNTVIRLLTMTNRPPSRIHCAAFGCSLTKFVMKLLALMLTLLIRIFPTSGPFYAKTDRSLFYLSSIFLRPGLVTKPLISLPRPRRKCPLAILRMLCAISMETMPFIILAMPRKGML